MRTAGFWVREMLPGISERVVIGHKSISRKAAKIMMLVIYIDGFYFPEKR